MLYSFVYLLMCPYSQSESFEAYVGSCKGVWPIFYISQSLCGGNKITSSARDIMHNISNIYTSQMSI
jgi:hypothetical protein